MSTPQPVPTAQHLAAAQGVHLPQLAQHVIDSLEAHLGAVLEHAKTASPGATAVIAKFGEDVLDKLEAWGVAIRGDLEAYRAKLEALSSPAGEASASAKDEPAKS